MCCVWFEQQSDRAALLIRQYVKDSLYDRISTRPFLSPIEKKWIAYQLLCAVNQCHKLNVSSTYLCSSFLVSWTGEWIDIIIVLWDGILRYVSDSHSPTISCYLLRLVFVIILIVAICWYGDGADSTKTVQVAPLKNWPTVAKMWSVLRCLAFCDLFVMAALCNRGAIIFLPCSFFPSFFLLSFFSSPNLSGRRSDVCHTSTHGVALVRI